MAKPKTFKEVHDHICTITKEQWDLLFSYSPKLTVAEIDRSLDSWEKEAVLNADGDVTNFCNLLYKRTVN